jgi:predicted DNA-binding antitoxin AbrB/MazE fold protein
MTRQVEAVFREGVLRPVEPLVLAENEHVLVTISNIPEEFEGDLRSGAC